ncbi:MAG: hypothetical protein K2I95_04870 [Treponemataceae bacterium]|nr:hypothetical protein [Treponemataceae bacterium]
MAHRIIFFVFAALFVFEFSSCSKKNNWEIVLDTSNPLALAPDVEWAVVVVPYSSFRKDTSWDAQAAGYCKQGECFPIQATSTISVEGKSQTWYRFESGWLPESAVKIYANKFRAEKAAKNLK